MKKRLKNIPLLLIYLIGINFYFCLWYLGSEGVALEWSFDCLSFSQLIYIANLAGLMVFIIYTFFKDYSRRLTEHYAKSNRFELLIQGIGGCVGYLVFLSVSLLTIVPVEVAFGYLKSYGFISLFLHHALLFYFVVIISNLGNRLGGIRKAFHYLSETFYSPRQVEMGFMFLDLNHSTKIAERLTNRKYSAFLRYCFQLLDEVVENYEGIEIYQYVGDEAILHWNYEDKVACTHAIYLFKHFRKQLQHNADYFLSEYDTKPTFKAAIHGGPVIQSALGSKTIHKAFHGDVLNTTSRILGICHKHSTDLLISRAYFNRLNEANLSDHYERIDDIVLNGKTHRLTVYKPISVTKELRIQFL